MNPVFEELIKKGMKVGKNTYLDWNCVIDQSHCWLIEFGDNVTVAPCAIILAHDASTKRKVGVTRIGRTIIEDDSFVGAGAIILPGVTIAHDTIVAAGAVVTKSTSPGTIVAGNPAKEIGKTVPYLKRHQELSESSHIFPKNFNSKLNPFWKKNLKKNKGYQV